MSNVLPFRKEPAATGVQLSAYPQDDGSTLYAVEVLFVDDTWCIASSSRNKAEGWKMASTEAISRGVPLLPVSIFPGRAA